jgi:hypothetical protein
VWRDRSSRRGTRPIEGIHARRGEGRAADRENGGRIEEIEPSEETAAVWPMTETEALAIETPPDSNSEPPLAPMSNVAPSRTRREPDRKDADVLDSRSNPGARQGTTVPDAFKATPPIPPSSKRSVEALEPMREATDRGDRAAREVHPSTVKGDAFPRWSKRPPRGRGVQAQS